MAELIKSEALLDKKIAKCVDCLEDKFTGKDGKRHVCVCGGTGCLSSDSKEILEKLQAAIKENGLSDTVEANIVGCFGFCSQGGCGSHYYREKALFNKCCRQLEQ